MMKPPRREPLPWQTPSAPADDPQASARVAAISANASYLPGDADPAFLQRDELRAARLQLDYLKPEISLQAAGIEHTIVVFGSTRILEPAAAQRRLDAALSAATATPGDAALQQRAAVAARLLARSHYYEVARELGALIAGSNPDRSRCKTVVMTGGGPGIMEAANRGAYDTGVHNVGLNIDLPHEQFPNPYVTPGLCFRFHYFAMRKLHFLRRARALVAFPGGFGTCDELFETLTLLQTRKMQAVPVVLMGESYWRRVIDIPYMIGEGVIDAEDAELFWYAEDARSAWRSIVAWYRNAGTPLFGDGD